MSQDQSDQALAGRIRNDFAYHPATDAMTKTAHSSVRHVLRDVADQLLAIVPAGRERALMLTKLEEAMFWANAGIARNPQDNTEDDDA